MSEPQIIPVGTLVIKKYSSGYQVYKVISLAEIENQSYNRTARRYELNGTFRKEYTLQQVLTSNLTVPKKVLTTRGDMWSVGPYGYYKPLDIFVEGLMKTLNTYSKILQDHYRDVHKSTSNSGQHELAEQTTNNTNP